MGGTGQWQWPARGEGLPSGGELVERRAGREGWQIWQTSVGTALVVETELHEQWVDQGLVEPGLFLPGPSGLPCAETYGLELVSSAQAGPYPQTGQQARAIAEAYAYTRSALGDVRLSGALYLPQLPHLLPVEEGADDDDDALILGRWLTGGMSVPATDGKRMGTWVPGWTDALQEELLRRFGWQATAPERIREGASPRQGREASMRAAKRRETRHEEPFCLAGRTELERFFRERIIDVVEREEAYRRMGITFPGPTLLIGPPGCGKTFAVERLVEYLGWPSYVVSSNTIASSYMHETSRLISQLFAQAMDDAPSVIVMDEMEAYLPDRAGGVGTHQHHIEEVAEFLRLIPQLPGRRVLMFAMTNVPERIDKAVMRKGRFDNVVHVGMPSKVEVESILASLLKDVPTERDLGIGRLARRLEGRPISDVAYVAKEAGRLAAMRDQDRVSAALLSEACDDLLRQDAPERPRFKIGFQ